MVYTTKPLRLEQTRKLATWQFLRNIRKRWILLLLLALAFLWITNMSPLWAGICIIAIYGLVLLLCWLRSRRIWARECERFNTPGFLTITDAGVLIEYEGMSSYYPWYIYKDATMVDDVLVLTMAGMQDICWNLESSTGQQRTSLLEFARSHVRTDKGVRIAPPRSVLSTTTVAQPGTRAEALEMGDIALTQRKVYSPWYWVVIVLIETAFLIICSLHTLEWGFDKDPSCTLAIVLFAWLIFRAIRTLIHPGLPMLRRSIQAYGRPGGEPCERIADGRSEYIIYKNSRWIRADYAAMTDPLLGHHVAVCRIKNTTFAYPRGSEPALFANAGRYKRSSKPFIIILLGIIPMLAAAAYSIYMLPHFPLSYLLWLLGLR